MEHHQKPAGSKPISKILKFLPRATSSVSFQNLYSPAKASTEKPHKSNLGIGFSSGPADNQRASSYALVYEPTSPKVSCMGQVKCKHYRKQLAAAANATTKPPTKFSRATSFTPVKTYYNEQEEDEEKITKVDPIVTKSMKTLLGIRSSLLRGGSRRNSDPTDNKFKTPANLPKAPSLCKMKRFSSGREAFMNFDWTTQVTPLDSCAHRREEIIMMDSPSSAPVMERNKGRDFVSVGGINLEPRKEINLWKRRTMAQPKPLQLHVVANLIN